MLKIDTLNQAYGGSHILRGLSFEVKTGEVTTLLGRNGVGKTTLLKSLMGLVKTKSGSITFDGKDILFFLKLCDQLDDGNAQLKFIALALLGILPVYYRTFAFVRG